MIVFPNAKINLGLQVTARRQDGYHDIATVFYPVSCTDVLEAVRAEKFSFTSSGLVIDASADNNLCVKAWKLLQHDYQLAPVAMHLHKNIPMGAGLGGGSADGAFTLRLLNDLFRLDIPEEKLLTYALRLGSDCPFFILNKPVYATGRGELMTPVNVPDLTGKKILLVNPGLHISTPWAFNRLTLKQHQTYLPDLVQQPVSGWKNNLENDFEKIVFQEYPQLETIQLKLYELGAIFAGMTGTGSTMFGIFNTFPEHPSADFPDNCKLIPIDLL